MQGTETAFEWVLLLISLLRFAITWILRSCSIIHLQDWMFVSGAQYLQIIRHCPISHHSLLYVCGKWTFMYCNRLLVRGIRPFSAAVLNSSPLIPTLCTFCKFHITGYSAMIPVWSKRIYSIQRALKCARREFKLYLFTEVYYVTLHASLVSFVCVWRCCAAQIREWMLRSEVNFNGFPLLREQGATDTV